MQKSIIVTSIFAILLGSTSLMAQENFDLKSNMMKLNAELNELQRGLIKGDEKRVNIALERFSKDSDDLLGDRENMLKMLPADLKKRKHKANLAVDSARKIKVNVEYIREALENKEGCSIRKRQAKAQEAYLNIVNACFKCHNLARDKERLK